MNDDLVREAFREWVPFEFDRLRRDGVDMTSCRSWRFTFSAPSSEAIKALIDDLPTGLFVHPIGTVKTTGGHVYLQVNVDETAAFTCEGYIERATILSNLAGKHLCNFGCGNEFSLLSKTSGA